MIVQICARTLQEAVLEGKLETSARPLTGGKPVLLRPLHWETDTPVPRMASRCLKLDDWCNVLATSTHRIFVNRNDVEEFLASFMTQDEIYDAVGASARARKRAVEVLPVSTS
ncbi:hypothetical protein [Novosphingobium olei]|uniref:Uncharacterized protein n=1 Tax=Novosphingobium olei TaxID=2728851 RepID=A0A7Y0G999_9SPHN|nr:hypothetical protein [Novosphingobium olei]NML93981.1 hypothetical protein [Novosphingobium olei]